MPRGLGHRQRVILSGMLFHHGAWPYDQKMSDRERQSMAHLVKRGIVVVDEDQFGRYYAIPRRSMKWVREVVG